MNGFPNKILLATDGSEDAALAARAAIELSGETGAELHVVHAWQSVPSAVSSPLSGPSSSRRPRGCLRRKRSS
jgi:nucleotide-binding universal stress UspA family protein